MKIEICKPYQKLIMDSARIEKILFFLQEVDNLKKEKRASYLSKGGRNESVAEHTWHMAMFALLLEADVNIDIDIAHVLKLILIHDLVEVYAGDTFVYDTDSCKTKKQREEKAAKKLFGLLPEDLGHLLSNWWQEFELVQTPEAKFADALDKLQAFEDEENRIRENWGLLWHYKQMGFYYVQISRYLHYFKPEQMRIYLYEDWNENPNGVIKDIFDYLGVDNTFIPNMSERKNPSVIPQNVTLQNFLLYPNLLKSFLRLFIPKKLRQKASLNLYKKNIRYGVKPPLLLRVRKKLIEVYRPDILELEKLINRDLSKWLEV